MSEILSNKSKQASKGYFYHRMFLSYKTGLSKIYSPEEIEIQKKSLSFEKEYNLSFESADGDSLRTLIHSLISKYHICRCFIDGSSVFMIRKLCKAKSVEKDPSLNWLCNDCPYLTDCKRIQQAAAGAA